MMLSQYLLKKELTKLRDLELRRTLNSCIIEVEKMALKQEAIRGLGTGEGLLLSFAAGCAASITVKHGAKLPRLSHFPLSQVLALVSLFVQIKSTK